MLSYLPAIFDLNTILFLTLFLNSVKTEIFKLGF